MSAASRTPAASLTPTDRDRAVLAAATALAAVGVVVVWAGGTGRTAWSGSDLAGTGDAGLAGPGTPRPPVFRVDVNAADGPEWSVLPGIGPTLARRIVETREAIGPFASVEDVASVRGLGPKTFERVRPFLTLDD